MKQKQKQKLVKLQNTQPVEAPKLLLDFGCGPNKREGFVGVDIKEFSGVDKVLDLANPAPYPWEDSSVDGIFTSHFVEHLTGEERIHFFNECYRILKPGAQIQIIVPDWSTDRAYGDPTHKWPPMSRWSFLYLNATWRKVNAPHVAYNCHFDGPIAGSVEQWVTLRAEDSRIFMSQHYVNAMLDLIVTLTKTEFPDDPQIPGQ